MSRREEDFENCWNDDSPDWEANWNPAEYEMEQAEKRANEDAMYASLCHCKGRDEIGDHGKVCPTCSKKICDSNYL